MWVGMEQERMVPGSEEYSREHGRTISYSRTQSKHITLVILCVSSSISSISPENKGPSHRDLFRGGGLTSFCS